MRMREQINAANKDTGAKISVNDFVIKAAALALKKVRFVCPGSEQGSTLLQAVHFWNLSLPVFKA